MTRSRQTADWGSRAGLAKVIPSSVAVGSGTGSADSLGTVTFSGASSVSLNGVFTSTYKHYRLICVIDTSSTPNDINLRMRLSGTDDANNLYYSARQNNFTYNTGYFGTATNPGTSTITFTSSDVGNNGGFGIIDIFSPQEAKRTKAKLLGNGTYVNIHGGFLHESNTQFDGISIIASTGTITGLISVYGYTN